MMNLELKATKEFGAIVELLESMEEQIETEISKFQEEYAQKYKLDITHDILNYATDYLKLKFTSIIKDALKNFDWFTIFIDCTEIDLNMNEIEAILSQTSRDLKDSIPDGSSSDDIQIILKKYLRKVICKVPTKWKTSIIQELLKRFEDSLNQLGVVVF